MGRIGRMLLVLVGAAACTSPQIGDGGTDPSPGGTGESGADAAPVGDPVDQLPATADAAPDDADGCYNGALRRLELIDATSYTSGTAPDDYYGLTAAIDGVPVGVFYIDLYGGIGSLAGGVLPGTYAIQGDDTVWSLCAVCAWATFGVSESKWVMAQSGTVTIDRADTQISGSVANLDLVEIDDQDLPIPGGCEALVSGISFDVPVE
jgi:hypothetical protein